ncbi:hypothetical protein EN795_31550 [bacterium M00.F.Ca.ET.152.01.1.1]|nr:hypothetical protein EN795_31550 [bacterium M00.F.Ca.ET.152.01.1.1]
MRLTYVAGSGPSTLTLRDGMDVSVSVSGSGNETSIYLSSGNVSLDLDGINGGFYHLSSGTAIIDGADGGADDSSYYFSTGEATISNGNAAFNRYYLSSGTATIHAGGVFNPNDDGGYNYYYLADGSYALHGADANQDIFVLNNAAQLQTTNLIDGGTGSYNEDGFDHPLQDTVAFNGSFDLTVPFSTVISNIEAYSIGGTLKVDQANLAGISSISGGTLTTEDAALDLSGMTVSSRIESSNAGGTTFTVTDASQVSHVYGGVGSDTLIASGLTLSADQRAAIFLNTSVETIIDGSGTYVAPLQLTAGADTLAFGSSDLTNSTVNATAPSLNPTDSIDLGGGYDVLALFGNGSFDLNGPSVLAGVDEVRLTYVAGSGPSTLTLRDGMDVSVSVSGSGNETSIYLSSGNVSLDLDGINGGFYHLSSGTAIIDGADGGADDSSYYFSTGEATISNGNAAFNRYYLSSGTATIHAGGVFNPNDDGGYNYYYLADGSYALHGADANQDIFVLNNAAQLQTTNLIEGGTGSYNEEGFDHPLQDAVAFNGSFDLTVPFSTVISNIEAYSIGGTLKVDQANLAGISSISGGTLTTEDAALDLSGMTVSSRIESSNAGGTTFTVTDASQVSHVYGGVGSDTLIASGLTLSADQRDSIFLTNSVEAIRDNTGLYGNDLPNVLYAIANDIMTGQGGSDTFVFSAGFGNAVITDFTPGSDIIRIPDELFATPQILDHATQQNADVVFDTLTGDILRLYNVNLASLSAGDFDLV